MASGGGGSPDDKPTAGSSTGSGSTPAPSFSLPVELPSGLPTELPSQLPTDLPTAIPSGLESLLPSLGELLP
ncbi:MULTISPECIES: hypothetical protein [Streptomyces]|jgi:hypothetical protein|uniref:Uncharacterized protein n=1 Tax=Streptomyces sp. 900129855 TaxID=3155129 RepID=A0ABV2ZR40_9ACTN